MFAIAPWQTPAYKPTLRVQIPWSQELFPRSCQHTFTFYHTNYFIKLTASPLVTRPHSFYSYLPNSVSTGTTAWPPWWVGASAGVVPGLGRTRHNFRVNSGEVRSIAKRASGFGWRDPRSWVWEWEGGVPPGGENTSMGYDCPESAMTPQRHCERFGVSLGEPICR
jgi:hypothetical protein